MTTTAAPSAEWKLNVDNGDRQTNKLTDVITAQTIFPLRGVKVNWNTFTDSMIKQPDLWPLDDHPGSYLS